MKLPLTLGERLDLVNEVLMTFYNKTESWVDCDFTASICYLVMAISHRDVSKYVDMRGDFLDRQFMFFMKTYFPQKHIVWRYIRWDKKEKKND